MLGGITRSGAIIEAETKVVKEGVMVERVVVMHIVYVFYISLRSLKKLLRNKTIGPLNVNISTIWGFSLCQASSFSLAYIPCCSRTNILVQDLNYYLAPMILSLESITGDLELQRSWELEVSLEV